MLKYLIRNKKRLPWVFLFDKINNLDISRVDSLYIYSFKTVVVYWASKPWDSFKQISNHISRKIWRCLLVHYINNLFFHTMSTPCPTPCPHHAHTISMFHVHHTFFCLDMMMLMNSKTPRFKIAIPNFKKSSFNPCSWWGFDGKRTLVRTNFPKSLILAPDMAQPCQLTFPCSMW